MAEKSITQKRKREGWKTGMTSRSEYRVWAMMIQRCTNPRHDAYKNYGGRGIAVCERWRQSFISFLEDMGPRPSLQYTIERVNNDGGYEPDNCIWLLKSEQCLNRRNTKFTLNGVTAPLIVWARRYGRNYKTIHKRVKAHPELSLEVILTRPLRQRRNTP